MKATDNYGSMWVKELREVVRKITLNGCDNDTLLGNLAIEMGLTYRKTTEMLNDMYKLHLIREKEDGLIWWSGGKSSKPETNPEMKPYLKAKKKLAEEKQAKGE